MAGTCALSLKRVFATNSSAKKSVCGQEGSQKRAQWNPQTVSYQVAIILGRQRLSSYAELAADMDREESIEREAIDWFKCFYCNNNDTNIFLPS